MLTYGDVVTVERVFAAWGRFRRGKRSRPDVLQFEHHLEDNLFGLHQELADGAYRHASYVPFKISDPKPRQIHKATVRDRVVHQLIVSSIEPLFERQFIYDSFSCRRHKGTHAAVQRLRRFLGQASHNNTQTVYVLKCDVKKFFASVDHEVLLELLAQRIGDPRLLGLLEGIINSLGNSHKRGMPLGNLTSQLFANVYLHELDWFVKHNLRQKHYIRYCDDFVIVGSDRAHLQSLVEPIEQFLATRLRLQIHPQKVSVRSWHQGVDFLGYVLKPHCTLLRTVTKRRVLARVTADNLPSYLGVCAHANSYRLQQVVTTKALTDALVDVKF